MTQLERIRAVVERVATSEGLEVVDVELHGRGRGTVVRIFLDKLAGAVPARLEVPEPAESVLLELAVEPIVAAAGTAAPVVAQATSTGAVGVSLADCQNISRQVGMILDVEEIMLDSYTLEVSSPGMDRKLVKPADYERFAGQRVAMELAPEAAFGIGRRFRGKLLGLREGLVQVDLDNGESRQISPNDIERAHLVPEFPKKEKPGKGPGKGQSKGQSKGQPK
ncbi:MAG: ribosome maturation factor RimP [Acidobacteria bacterium]|nr:ribosome maturation factor RimP [Acidobacteriota bacterium]